MKIDVHTTIAQSVIALLEKDIVPWQAAAGDRTIPRNLATGRPYKGLSFLLLRSQGQESPYWLTVQQVKELGGQVINGYQPSFVIEQGLGGMELGQVLNLSQCSGIPEPEKKHGRATRARTMSLEKCLRRTPLPPKLERDGCKAYYCPPTDTVALPERGFIAEQNAEELLLLHLIVHATAHPSRLSRGRNWFACFDYEPFCREELIACIGAALLGTHMGITAAANVANGTEGWIQLLEREPGVLLAASVEAQEAARYVVGWAVRDRR